MKVNLVNLSKKNFSKQILSYANLLTYLRCWLMVNIESCKDVKSLDGLLSVLVNLSVKSLERLFRYVFCCLFDESVSQYSIKVAREKYLLEFV